MTALTIFAKLTLVGILVAGITVGKRYTCKSGEWFAVSGFLPMTGNTLKASMATGEWKIRLAVAEARSRTKFVKAVARRTVF